MFGQLLFIISAALVILSTLLMLYTQNIIHSCIFLLGTLIGVAGLYVTLGADFVAATQIMVYVGGVTILMLFAVMVTGGQEFIQNQLKGKFLTPIMGTKKTFLVAILGSTVLVSSLTQIIFRACALAPLENAKVMTSTVEEIGILLLTDHILAFEMVSILLLGALLGAAIIARPLQK